MVGKLFDKLSELNEEFPVYEVQYEEYENLSEFTEEVFMYESQAGVFKTGSHWKI